MTFASKELIERAVALMGRTVTYETINEYQDAIEDLARDLAKATPLPTDAEHEVAIKAWRKEAFTSTEDGFCRVTFGEIDAICDLARRAPRPGPKPIDEGDANRLLALIDASLASGSPVTEIASDHDGTPCRLVLASGVGIKLVDSWVRGLLGEPATEPKPEPQLLGNPLELPEEARGPSEVEQLRKERDEANIRAFDAENRLAEAFDVLCRLACLGYGDRPGNSDGNRIAIDALGHLFDCVWYQPEGGDGCWANKADGPIEAALSTPPQPNHASDDDELIRYADRSSRGQIDGFDWVAADALSELVRRALARRAK